MNRPGVIVRARRGFEARPEAVLVRDRARATMETDLSYTAIPVSIQTAPPTPDKKLYRLPITMTMPASALTFVPDGDKATARAAFYIGSVDDKGGAATSPARRRASRCRPTRRRATRRSSSAPG